MHPNHKRFSYVYPDNAHYSVDGSGAKLEKRRRQELWNTTFISNLRLELVLELSIGFMIRTILVCWKTIFV